MLEYLRIQNLALIDDVELEFAAGLNALTGETGAGKSFILRAVNFLTGDRLTTEMVRPGADKAVAEALFVLDGEEYVIRRELYAESGRSRLYVNDQLSSREAVLKLRPGLILHTSQHGQQKLLSPAYQAALLDAFVGDEALLGERTRLLRELRGAAASLAELDERLAELSERREFLEYQAREIEKVAPEGGEEEELLARQRAMKDTARIEAAAGSALENLLGGPEGLGERMERLVRDLKILGDFDDDFEEEAAALGEVGYRLADLEARLRGFRFDDGGMDAEAVESRLFALQQLKRKLGRSLPEILAMRDEIEENLSFLDAAQLDRKQLARREAEARAGLSALLETLGRKRREAAAELTSSLEKDLVALGFSDDVRVIMDFEPVEIASGVTEDRARVLWVPNPGQAPQPLDRIASGGELSRFLLAMVGLLTEAERPTLIFDEVDSGIGGLTLGRVAERLHDLSRRQQVVLITHWPQLAARAERHFLVHKEVLDGATFTRCRRLRGDEVMTELSRMGGGGEQGKALARQLLLPGT